MNKIKGAFHLNSALASELLASELLASGSFIFSKLFAQNSQQSVQIYKTVCIVRQNYNILSGPGILTNNLREQKNL